MSLFIDFVAFLSLAHLTTAYLDMEANDLLTNSQQDQLPGCLCVTQGAVCRRVPHLVSALGDCLEILNTFKR